MTSYRVVLLNADFVRMQRPDYDPATHVAVPNALIHDTHLSYEALGLWTYLQTLPADTLITAAVLAPHGVDSVESLTAALLELENAGWLQAVHGGGDDSVEVTTA